MPRKLALAGLCLSCSSLCLCKRVVYHMFFPIMTVSLQKIMLIHLHLLFTPFAFVYPPWASSIGKGRALEGGQAPSHTHTNDKGFVNYFLDIGLMEGCNWQYVKVYRTNSFGCTSMCIWICMGSPQQKNVIE